MELDFNIPISILQERILARIAKDPITECWNWTGQTREGYPHWTVRSKRERRTWYVHRLMYSVSRGVLLKRGRKENDLVVDHICNNPSCINPRHLQLIMSGENISRSPKHPSLHYHRDRWHPKVTPEDIHHYVNRSGFDKERCSPCYNRYHREYRRKHAMM